MKSKGNIFLWLQICYIIITGSINLYGYFKLPEKVATQFSFTGEQVNHMSKSIYLLSAFGIVLLLSYFGIFKAKEQRLKYLLLNSVIVIANIVMIVIQL
jgi:uncharacterized membrane protein